MRLLVCLVLIVLICSAHAIEKHERIRSVSSKKSGLSRLIRRAHQGTEKVKHHINNFGREKPDEELVNALTDDNWDRIRSLGIEIGKMFETTESIFEKAEETLEYVELAKKANAVKEAVEALKDIDGSDPNSKLVALAAFCTSAAEFVPIPGVHEFLLAYSSMITAIVGSLQTFEKAVQEKQAQGTEIVNPGVMDGGRELYDPLSDACQGKDFELSVDARNWFYDHREILKAFSGSEVWKPDPNHSLLVHAAHGRYSDIGVMNDWVKKFWPIAALVAYGKTTEGVRFCMCGRDWARQQNGESCW